MTDWINTIPQSWLIIGVAILAALLIFGIAKKFLWLVMMILLAAGVIGGIWLIAGQASL